MRRIIAPYHSMARIHSVNSARQEVDRTEWHKIVVWGEQAELVQQFLHKGSHALIEGRIQSREWQDKEGQKRTSFEIVAISFWLSIGAGTATVRLWSRLHPSNHTKPPTLIFRFRRRCATHDRAGLRTSREAWLCGCIAAKGRKQPRS